MIVYNFAKAGDPVGFRNVLLIFLLRNNFSSSLLTLFCCSFFNLIGVGVVDVFHYHYFTGREVCQN